MIQYLGEHKLFNEKYIIFILFCIFLIEFKNYFSDKNKRKRIYIGDFVNVLRGGNIIFNALWELYCWYYVYIIWNSVNFMLNLEIQK